MSPFQEDDYRVFDNKILWSGCFVAYSLWLISKSGIIERYNFQNRVGGRETIYSWSATYLTYITSDKEVIESICKNWPFFCAFSKWQRDKY